MSTDPQDTRIEEHLAHHDAAIDDISAQMADQWDAIRRIERKLEVIITHLKSMEPEGEAPEITPPPHY